MLIFFVVLPLTSNRITMTCILSSLDELEKTVYQVELVQIHRLVNLNDKSYINQKRDKQIFSNVSCNFILVKFETFELFKQYSLAEWDGCYVFSDNINISTCKLTCLKRWPIILYFVMFLSVVFNLNYKIRREKKPV